MISEVDGGSHVVLTCRGAPGAGKTTLLDRLSRARGATVLRGRGVPGESGIPYAALQLLLRRHHATIRSMAAPERDALLAVVSLTGPDETDPDLLAAATHRLLTVLSADAPVLCLIDDAQWIDAHSLAALCGAARLLHERPVAIVFAADDSPASRPLTDFTTRRLRPLDDAAAHALLREAHPNLADGVRETVVAESSGNPRAMSEFAAALPAMVRHGRHPHAIRPWRIYTLPAPRRLSEELDTRWGVLAPSTRWALLCAAVDGAGRPSIITEDAPALAPAADAGLINIDGDTIRFVHPLLRSAIYRRMPRHQKLAAHRRQAEALEHTSHAEQRLWHLTAAVTGADEPLAAELESTTLTASIRDCAAELAVVWERAANLSSTARKRNRRLIAAASAAIDAGDLVHGTALLDQTIQPELSAPDRIALVRLRAAIEAASGSSGKAAADTLAVADSAPVLLDAARYAWDSADTALLAAIAERTAIVRPPRGSDSEPLTRAVAGVGRLVTGDVQEGLRSVAAAFADLGDPRSHDREPVALSLTAGVALAVGADEFGLRCIEAAERRWRSRGAAGRLSRAMLTRSALLFHSGHTAEAVAVARRARELAVDLGQGRVVEIIDYWNLLPTAMSGDFDDYDALVRGLDSAQRPGIAPVQTRFAADVAILLDLGQRRYTMALRRCETAPDADVTGTVGFIPGYVEAAVGAGHGDRAKAPLARIGEHARYSTQDWVRAVAARCHALVDAGTRTEEYYRRAVDLHGDGSRPFEHGRTRLLYGEWLRRRLRHRDAQRELGVAREIFGRLGARAWERRAQDELSAARKRVAAVDERTRSTAGLTPQETQVVRLAAAGFSNREIGARLTLSPRTVGYHLHKSFPKLGVSSRHELSRTLGDLPV